MSKLSKLSHLNGGKETTQGVPVTPTFSVPYTLGSLTPEDVIEPLRDESVRANDSVLQGMYGGAASSTNGFSGKPHADTFGNFLRAIIGPDTVGTVVSGLYPHTFKSTGTQPASYTWTDYDAVEARAYPGCMLSELKISIDTAGDVTYDTSWSGWPSAAASTPTPTFTTLQPFLGWQLTWSANAVSSTRVQTCDLTFRREVEVIPGSDGSQAPRETFAGPWEFMASAKILFEDTTDRARFLTYAQQALVISLTQPVALGGASLAVTATKASWNKATLDRSGKYAALNASIDGVYNATDAGPCQVLLNSPQSAAY